MTLDDIKREVAAVAEYANKDDSESAHVTEDALHLEFIEHVANTAGGELAEMAREVLKTEELDFSHWYA